MSTARIVLAGVFTAVGVLLVVPVVDWPVALGIVRMVAGCGIGAYTLCRRR